MDIIDFQHAPIASLLFLITLVTSIAAFNNPTLMGQLILHPTSVARGERLPTLFTSGFIHANWLHLGMNMFTYYFFAYHLEHALGHWQFMVVYLGSLVLSSLTSVQLHKDEPHYRSLGASGAISGLLLSAIMMDPTIMLLLYGIVPIPGWLFAGLYIGYSYYASKKQFDNVAHDAHLFGALAGAVLTIVVKPDVIQILKAWLM